MLTGLAFVGKLKSYAECFPPSGNGEPINPEGLDPEGAKMLGALFKLKGRGVPMTVERISLH